MKILLLLFAFCALLVACNTKPSNQVPKKSVEELKKELFQAACNEQIKKEYEKEVAKTAKELNDKQLKVILKKMKDNIKCQ